MAVRDTWPVTIADGDQLDDGFFNGNTDNTGVRRNAMTEDTTEYTADATSGWVDMGFSETFTPSTGVNSIINGIYFEIDAKKSDTASFDDDAVFRIKITNDTNSAAAYAYVAIESRGGANELESFHTSSSTYATFTGYSTLRNITSDGSADVAVIDTFEALQAGATYTATVQVVRRSGTDSTRGYIDNINLTIYWGYLQATVTSGWA